MRGVAEKEGVAQGAPVEPLVVCVLAAWNNWEHTERCLRALEVQAYARLQVIVVDNGSVDGSVGLLRSGYPSTICIENGNNLGFAKACNVGARRGIEMGAEFVWFLNNDTEPPPDTAGRLVEKAGSDTRLGVVGSVLFFLHDRTRVQAWGGGSIDLWSGFNRHFTSPRRFGAGTYITFASALVRREVFVSLNGLWEGLFLYFEDSDFCLRAREAGWGLGVAEGTAILHAEGGSSAGRQRRSSLMERIQTASGLRFLGRHGKVPGISIGIFLLLRLGKRIAMGDWAAFRGVLEGVGDWWKGRVTPFRAGA